MRIAKRLGLVLVMVCAFSAMAVSSASASPTFLSHPLGLLLASAGGAQKFKTQLGTIECSALKLLPPDTTVALQALSILVVVDYEKCELPLLSLGLVVHPVRYNIDANGLVTLENNVLILGTGNCVITVPAASNQSLQTVKFTNNAGNKGILLEAKVTKITSSGTGGPLNACVYATESVGTYEGEIHVKLDSGTIRWDP